MTMYDDENAGFENENPPEESSNRTFLIIAGVLGGLYYWVSALRPHTSFTPIGPTNRQTQLHCSRQPTRPLRFKWD